MSDKIDWFGFELYQKLYQNEINKKEDVIILFIHWYLMKSGFRCFGLADGKDCAPLGRGSELLPNEWNLRQNYTLRYIRNKKMYILIGMKSDADLLLNLLKHHDNSIANIQFPIEETIHTMHGTLETVIPSYQTVLQVIKKEFVDPICTENDTNEATTQTGASVRIQRIVLDGNNSVITHDATLVRQELARLGARDLDPFAYDGGGMIFNPFEHRHGHGHGPGPGPGHVPGGLGVPGRLPPGAVPPGARFDPFGPPDIDVARPRPRGLDDDHLPPPGYNDMFQ